MTWLRTRKHPSEDDWIVHAMGMGGAPLDAHLAGCEACRRGVAEVASTLATMAAVEVPEPGVDLRVRALAAAGEPRSGVGVAWVRWAAVGGALAVAFLMGRFGWRAPARPATTPVAAIAAPAPRLLVVVVANHLDRTQMLLVQLAHAGDRGGGRRIDLSNEQSWARELLASNRLYLQGADAAGQGAMAEVLDALEPVLLQIVHGPADPTAAQWHALQARIASSGVLFQVRVADQKLQSSVERGAL